MEKQNLIEMVADKYCELGSLITKLMYENEELKTKIAELEGKMELSQEEKIDLITALFDEEFNLVGVNHPQYNKIVDVLYKEVCAEEINDSRAVLLVAKDVSGSMNTWESYMSRCITNWTKGVLEKQYDGNIEVRYITFATLAEEVEENEFHSRGHKGGTIVSSGLRKINEISESYRYEDKDDIYILLLGDGDNLTSDNPRCEMLLNRLVNKAEKVWYTEMNPYGRHSTFGNMLTQNKDEIDIEFNVIKEERDVYQAILDMFNR